ncbi:MAG: hypothetical protein V3S28_03800 [Acidimicrobiia bacterium]
MQSRLAVQETVPSRIGEQGATLVEYAVLLAILVVLWIPVIGATNYAMSGVFAGWTDHFSDAGSGPTSGNGTTTTTTVPPTTTTTTAAPGDSEEPEPQTKTAVFEDEISVIFEATDGVVTYGSVEAHGWTYKVTKDTGRRVHLKFTHEESGDQVTVKGWLHKRDELKTSVKQP